MNDDCAIAVCENNYHLTNDKFLTCTSATEIRNIFYSMIKSVIPIATHVNFTIFF